MSRSPATTGPDQPCPASIVQATGGPAFGQFQLRQQTLRHGQEVYLCWREGESRVEHWHPIHTGIAGRQEVDPADLGVWEWCN